MPKTKKGEKIMANMIKEYGAKKGKQVFYATENKGKITGLTKSTAKAKKKAKARPKRKPMTKGKGKLTPMAKPSY